MHSVGVLRRIQDSFLRSGRFIANGLDSRAGKVTLFTIMGGATTFLAVFTFVSLELRVPRVNADDVTTSVHILNTPPVWTADAQESSESSVTVPTNTGTSVTWVGTGTDSNNDNYYLLICKTGSAPTPHSGSAPTCNGGDANQWAVSASTASAAQASAATSTTEAFTESNAWFAWICDANATLGQCNATAKQGTGSTASPFIVNHPPVFASVSNDAPRNPGQTVTWNTVAYDTDTLTTNTVRLLVCKAADFAAGDCGAGGTWATSTLASSNPSTSTPLAIPTQDKTYNAYAYLVDAFGHVATSTVQATNSSFAVSNIAPTITAATISLIDTDNAGNLTLLNPYDTSGPYKVAFQVDDNNSCLNASSGNEVSNIITDVYRSGVTQASCQVSGDYNSNSCYPSASPLTNFSCTQDGGSCSGASDTSSTWTCTYSYWYNADPTDAGTPYAAQNWLASVQAGDDNYATSTLTESSTGNELVSFLAFDVPQTGVGFGSLQPGQQNDPLATTTALIALGNVGMDENIYGDTMCTTWSTADSCDSDGVNASNDIPIVNQKVATSSVAYASVDAYTLAGSTTPVTLAIHVQKTTSTSSPQQKSTWWGINIPLSLTVAGDYSGQDTIIAQTSAAAHW